eukprot:TRINITY_DN1848_c0_g1_i6.p1 TRINITY_DN1848_c0_g1~~TRINITY_DN1848_c0_g1_i6.p1  ORF type:complete len:603 (-),score=142.73 TRINITY_DN1848_c0_g1_i6:525-2333(-)
MAVRELQLRESTDSSLSKIGQNLQHFQENQVSTWSWNWEKIDFNTSLVQCQKALNILLGKRFVANNLLVKGPSSTVCNCSAQSINEDTRHDSFTGGELPLSSSKNDNVREEDKSKPSDDSSVLKDGELEEGEIERGENSDLRPETLTERNELGDDPLSGGTSASPSKLQQLVHGHGSYTLTVKDPGNRAGLSEKRNDDKNLLKSEYTCNQVKQKQEGGSNLARHVQKVKKDSLSKKKKRKKKKKENMNNSVHNGYQQAGTHPSSEQSRGLKRKNEKPDDVTRTVKPKKNGENDVSKESPKILASFDEKTPQNVHKSNQDNNMASIPNQEEATKKKAKRGPLTDKRKEKKKAARRRKRALMNKELGVKRLKLMPVQKPKPVIVCKYYMKGKCSQGKNCSFSHDAVPETKSQVCTFHVNRSCLRGDECPFSHDLSAFPCKYYHVNGHCSEGNNCRFSHKPMDEGALQSFLKQQEHERQQRCKKDKQQGQHLTHSTNGKHNLKMCGSPHEPSVGKNINAELSTPIQQRNQPTQKFLDGSNHNQSGIFCLQEPSRMLNFEGHNKVLRASFHNSSPQSHEHFRVNNDWITEGLHDALLEARKAVFKF